MDKEEILRDMRGGIMGWGRIMASYYGAILFSFPPDLRMDAFNY